MCVHARSTRAACLQGAAHKSSLGTGCPFSTGSCVAWWRSMRRLVKSKEAWGGRVLVWMLANVLVLLELKLHFQSAPPLVYLSRPRSATRSSGPGWDLGYSRSSSSSPVSSPLRCCRCGSHQSDVAQLSRCQPAPLSACPLTKACVVGRSREPCSAAICNARITGGALLLTMG